MLRIKYKTKKSARDAKEAWSDANVTFGMAAPVLGGLGLSSGGLTAALIASFSALLARDAEKVANDPPRFDFDTPTRARRRESVPVPNTNVGELVDLFQGASLDASSHLQAFVRATERAQGAEIYKATESLAKRISEAELFANLAAEDLGRVADFAATVATEVENIPASSGDPELEHELKPISAEFELVRFAPDFLEESFVLGVDENMLRNAWEEWSVDPIESFRIRLFDCSKASRALSGSLRDPIAYTDVPSR